MSNLLQKCQHYASQMVKPDKVKPRRNVTKITLKVAITCFVNFFLQKSWSLCLPQDTMHLYNLNLFEKIHQM